jgi:hypothetical protein
MLISKTEDEKDTSFILTVRSHVNIDSTNIIKDKNKIFGNWISVSNRGVIFKDSVSIKDDKVYRSKLTEIKINKNMFLKLSNENYSLFEKEDSQKKYKQKTNRGYEIIKDKYLLLGGVSMHMPEPYFIGMDKDGRLIICHLFVQIKRKENDFIRYKTIVYEMIFEKVMM